jgi:hypothetical protein
VSGGSVVFGGFLCRACADKAKRDKAKAEAKKREVKAERKLQQERQHAEEALAE